MGGRGQRVSVVGGHTRPGRTWGAAGGLQTGGGGFPPPFFLSVLFLNIFRSNPGLPNVTDL